MKEYPDFPDDTRCIVNDRDLRLHDLMHQQAECRIDQIIETNLIEVFAKPDQACMPGYKRCRSCFAPMTEQRSETVAKNAGCPAAGVSG